MEEGEGSSNFKYRQYSLIIIFAVLSAMKQNVDHAIYHIQNYPMIRTTMISHQRSLSFPIELMQWQLKKRKYVIPDNVKR